MIIYFANREMKILGQASTSLPKGFVISDDNKAEEIESGVATFSCYVGYDKADVLALEEMATVGNYLLRSNGDESELYTIIDSEKDTKNQEFYIYAEDAGLDLINEVVGEFEATEPHTADWYINKFAADAGFEIGLNEIPETTTRKLTFESESTVTSRIAEIAAEFGGFEVSYTFKIDGLTVTNMYINIHKQRGKDAGIQLLLNRDIDRIVTKKTIANLATELVCEGGTPDDKEEPITLEGYAYDDGDFYIEGKSLKSRTALNKWGRFGGGHIAKPFSCNALTQGELCAQAIAELKKVCDFEVNFEVDISKLPENVKIGDRVNVVDDAGGLYVSTRILLLETSITKKTHKATLGEHLIKTSGISQKVADLAAQFAKQTESVKRAQQIASNAAGIATEAKAQAEEAATVAGNANAVADEAKNAAATATQSAANAQAEAIAAQAAVNKVEESVSSIEKTVTEAKLAANNAQLAADTATQKADEAKTAAENAQAKADSAETAAGNAQTAADNAVTKANTAIGTADTAKTTAEEASATAQAAKLDAEQAEKDIATFAENLTTVENTMKADYARKTDLTEATASLQTQITQNANEISSTASKVQVIDETANDAAIKAQAAYYSAQQAQAEADSASAAAETAQAEADTAKAAAEAAQAEADTAKAAYETAKSVADHAEAALNAAIADLETVQSRADATEAEIAEAQAAVESAQTAANTAKTDAETARATAEAAQTTANAAVETATQAQINADYAAQQAENARKAVEIVNQSAASEAVTKATEAQNIAAEAQRIANTAKTNATTAQAKADKAAEDAATAQAAADNAEAKAQQAASDLATAQQNLIDVTSRVDATEEEVAAAQAAVATAQAKANEAATNAATAQNTADTAKANAATAQTAANNAKTAADNAQTAANEAKSAADKAQADVNALEKRVTTAETSITQNSEQIELRATKTEVTTAINNIEIGGRNYLLNSNFALTETLTGTTDKHESINPVYWGTYNSGIPNPTTSYHAHIDTDTFGFNVIEFNESDGNRNWKAASHNIKTITEYKDNFRISVDLYATGTGTRIYCGFHCYLVGGTTQSFHAGQYSIKVTEVGKWVRMSTEVKLPENVDLTKEIRFYIYGYGFSSNSILYIKNVSLNISSNTVDWTPAPEDFNTRITAAETAITQNAEEITLKATKEEVTETAQTLSASIIEQVSDMIRMCITDGNNQSLMVQTENGWTFSTASLQNTVNSTAESLDELTNTVGGIDAAVDILNKSVEDLGVLAEYVKIGTYTYTDEDGTEQTEPSIDLGENDTGFKLKITNTRICFTDGANELVWIDSKTKSLNTQKVKAEEIQLGGWVWQTRNNGRNLGLVWKGAVN